MVVASGTVIEFYRQGKTKLGLGFSLILLIYKIVYGAGEKLTPMNYLY